MGSPPSPGQSAKWATIVHSSRHDRKLAADVALPRGGRQSASAVGMTNRGEYPWPQRGWSNVARATFGSVWRCRQASGASGGTQYDHRSISRKPSCW
jgi:hypothetical protein